jgi:UDP-N-acetylglucosamine diphosphorylase / glucose-1-phosphate thymidylyltransferase / UDP-N-acetylgalactosamine diphosphorylase / glucosamine-1-phosphate N-acetyltransferase / galactosamine-1-phosphate N-acetyltransferase
VTYLCLAAGKGTRFAGLGKYLQKCMYPIGAHPFLEYSIASILASGTYRHGDDRLVVVVGYLGEQITSYFGAGYRGLPIEYVRQEEPLGTGHAVACARREAAFDEAIVWLADLFVTPERFDALRTHREATVLTIARDDEEPNDDVRIDTEGDLVTRSWRGSAPLFDIGAWKLGKAVLDRIAETKADEYRVLLNVQRAIEARVPVGFVTADEWVHLGAVHPTPAENLRRVVDRIRREEHLVDHHQDPA